MSTLPARSRRQVFVAFAAIMLAILLAAIDQTIVVTALPRIVADLRGFEDLAWVVTGYLISSTVTIPLYGKLSDLYGRRTMLVISISLFLTGSALCGLAASMEQLIAFRVVQGLGAGGLIPLAHAAIADLFSPRERGRYQAYVGAMWGIAAILGPLVGGTLTDAASWRWIFFVNLPLGAFALVVVLRTMPPPRERSRPRIDFAGAAVLSAAVTLLLLAIAWGGSTYPWDSWQVIGAAAGACALFALFAWLERRAPEPLLPLDLFGRSIFRVSSLANAVLGAILFAVLVYVPLHVQEVLGASATSAGVILLPLTIGWVILSIISGQLVARTGRYRIFPLVGNAIVLAATLLLTQIDAGTSRTVIALDLLVFGVGMGTMIQIYLIATQNDVDPADIGIATAGLQFFRFIGASVVLAGLGALLTNRVIAELQERFGAAAERIDTERLLQGSGGVPAELADGAREALAAGLHSVFLALVPIAVIGLATGIALRERPLRTSPGAAPGPEATSA